MNTDPNICLYPERIPRGTISPHITILEFTYLFLGNYKGYDLCFGPKINRPGYRSFLRASNSNPGYVWCYCDLIKIKKDIIPYTITYRIGDDNPKLYKELMREAYYRTLELVKNPKL